MKIWRGVAGAAIGLAVLVAFIISLQNYLQSRPQIPQFPDEFLKAREDAADISRQIVELTVATNEKIKAVNLSDLSGNPYQALSLIQEAREMNSRAQGNAFELARFLQKLAESLDKVKPKKSKRLAYEAVAVELSLVSEFLSYVQDLNKFLESLSQAIITDRLADRKAAEQHLFAVNRRVGSINKINQEFQAKILALDNALNGTK